MVSLKPRPTFAAWLAGVLLLLTWAAWRLPQFSLETDLLALLPQPETPAVQHSQQRLAEAYSRRLLLLVSSPDLARSTTAAAQLEQQLQHSGAFQKVAWRLQAPTVSPVWTAKRGYASAPVQAPEVLWERTLADLYSPAAGVRWLPFAQDPFNTANDALNAAFRPLGKATLLGEGLGVVDAQGAHALLLLETRANPFSSQDLPALMCALQEAEAFSRKQGVRLAWSGVAPHALHASQQARQEAGVLGGASGFLCLALVWLVFGALRPALLALLSMAVGTLLALLLTDALLGPLHLLTVVFGTSLVGVSLDYALHFLADQYRKPAQWQPSEALPHIRTALLMGFATTALGYAAFASADLLILRQMAVFAVLGLLGAALTVAAAFPALAKPSPLPHAAFWLAWARPMRLALPAWLRWLLALLGTAVLVCAYGVQMQTNDQPSALQRSPPALLQGEKTVRTVLGGGVDRRYFLLLANGLDPLLAGEERLRHELERMQQPYRALSQVLPSRQQQQQNFAAQQALYAALGADLRAYTGLVVSAPPSGDFLVWKDIATDPLFAPFTALYLGEVSPGQHASVVLLENVRDAYRLGLLPFRFSLQGVEVHWQDPLQQAESALRSQRREAQKRLLWVYGAMWLLLICRYGPKGGTQTLLPPVLASLCTLSLLAVLAVPLNLFVVLALLPVLGFGVDYAIFLREGWLHAENAPLSSRLAVWLAAGTALLSFGGLAFSSTPFLQAIGLTLSLGVGLSLAFALWLAPEV